MRNTRRENYLREGLIFPNRSVKHTGQRAGLYLPAPDTAAREKIITPYLKQRHSYRETAHELILLGFEPPRQSDIRGFLLKYCDGMIATYHPYRRGHAFDEKINPQAYRKHILRQMRPVGDTIVPSQLDWRMDDELSARDFPVIASLAANGLIPPSYHGAQMPDGALYDLRRMRSLVEKTTDAQLLQAYHDAQELVSTHNDELEKWLMRHVPGGVSYPDLTQLLLPSHRCTTQHTPAQLMLPRAIMVIVDPASTSVEPLPPAFQMMLRGVGEGLEVLQQ
jgi:hypothetical protein